MESEYEEAELKILDAYFGAIQVKYRSSDLDTRKTIRQGLEKILNPVESNISNSLINYPVDPQTAKQIREKMGMTQVELAEKIGVHRQTIGKYEVGLARKFTGKDMKKYVLWLQSQEPIK